jgi:hypothetical protein
VKLHEPDEAEVIHFIIDPVKHPKLYTAKKDEMKESGMSEEEAVSLLATFVVELEVYNSPGMAIFAIEADAIDGGCNVVDPFTGWKCKASKE